MLIWASRELLFYVVPSFGGILGLSATQGVSDDTIFWSSLCLHLSGCTEVQIVFRSFIFAKFLLQTYSDMITRFWRMLGLLCNQGVYLSLFLALILPSLSLLDGNMYYTWPWNVTLPHKDRLSGTSASGVGSKLSVDLVASLPHLPYLDHR